MFLNILFPSQRNMLAHRRVHTQRRAGDWTESVAAAICPLPSERQCVRVCVCVFLYLLQSGEQNTSEVRTFFYLVLTNLAVRLRVEAEGLVREGGGHHGDVMVDVSERTFLCPVSTCRSSSPSSPSPPAGATPACSGCWWSARTGPRAT